MGYVEPSIPWPISTPKPRQEFKNDATSEIDLLDEDAPRTRAEKPKKKPWWRFW